MKKGIAFIPLIIIIFLVATGGVVGLRLISGSKGNTTTTNPTYAVSKGPLGQPTEQQGQISSVPLPSEEDVIRNFFSLINEKKIPEAIGIMSKINTDNDSTKQAWGVQFNAIKSINVQKIEKSMEEDWLENSHIYKTTLEAYVSSEAASAPIPYYGWGDNPNIKWIELVKEDGLWKVNEIATGP